MRNRCLSVENQHMVNFISAVSASRTSHLTGKLLQRRRGAALKAEVLITAQPVPTMACSSAWSLLHEDTVPFAAAQVATCKYTNHLSFGVLLLISVEVARHNLSGYTFQVLERKH